MAKILLLSVISLSSVSFADWHAELYAQTALPPKAAFGKVKIGGLSGMVWTGQKLIAVSDDRGKYGGPRYYDFELTLKDGNVSLKPLKSYPVKVPKKGWVLDLEALVLLPNGEFLFSTEGDTNTKPRSMPHLFTVLDGALKSDFAIPEKFLPEPLGRQRKGIENNRAFEGVTITPDGQHVFAVPEAAIMTDQPEVPCQTQWLRIVRFSKPAGGEGYAAIAEYPYPLDNLSSAKAGPEVFRGVSEILAFDAQKLLVLERGARVTTKGVTYTSAIYAYDIPTAKDVSGISPLCTHSPIAGKKELLVNLAEVLKSENTENFEALSWGPNLPDGRRTLLVLSDNNFSVREKTQLLVFAMKEVP